MNCSPSGEPLENCDDEIIGHELSKLHPVGEGWVFRGYDVFPYDAGHTLFVGFTSGEEGMIRLQCHTDSQAHILEFLERYVTRAEQANAGDA